MNPVKALPLLGYHSFRAIGYPKLLPINLTVSVTYSCPSRVKPPRPL